jgi:hypothetical protein
MGYFVGAYFFVRRTENPDLPWHYSSLSARLDLHPEFVNSLSDKPWPSYVKRWALSTGALSIEPIQADLVYEPGIAEWMSKFCVDIDFVRKHIDAIGTSARCRNRTLNWQ